MMLTFKRILTESIVLCNSRTVVSKQTAQRTKLKSFFGYQEFILFISSCSPAITQPVMPRCRSLRIGAFKVFTGNLWLSAFAEYVATLFFVFVVCGASLRWEGTPSTLQISLAAGFAMATAVQAFRWVSRPLVHANPCVSVAAFLSGDKALVPVIIYILAQCFGAITGAGLLYVLSPAHARGILGATIPATGLTNLQALGTEVVLTFFLVITMLSTLDATKYDPYARYDASAAVGLATATCYLIGVPLTGAGLNPARSLGPAVFANTWNDHWVYWCGPLIGAVFAGLMYNILLHSRSGRDKHDPPSDNDEISLTH